MKITQNSAPIRTDRVSPAVDGRAQVSNAGQAVGETTKVQLSEMATRLAQLETQFSGSGDFDAKKVEEVRTAIAEGRFKVNAEAVADKLMASVAELLGKR